jgi:hypothetical protein
MNTSNKTKKTPNASGKNAAKRNSFYSRLKSSYKTLLLVAIVAVISVTSTSLVAIMLSNTEDEIYLPSVATIKTIEVETYWDSGGEIRRENLTWNEINVEKLGWDEVKVSPVNTTLYVKSVSNFRVTLNMFLTDWNPVEISDYLTISWDYNGTILNPGEIIPVTMTLSASSSEDFINYLVENEITGFDVAIHIVASD